MWQVDRCQMLMYLETSDKWCSPAEKLWICIDVKVKCVGRILLALGREEQFRLILLTPASYMLISELFRTANKSFSSWRKICRLSGVTFTSTHSERTARKRSQNPPSLRPVLLIYKPETGSVLTRGNGYVQDNKWILVSVVHMIHFVHKLNHLLEKGRQQKRQFKPSSLNVGEKV